MSDQLSPAQMLVHLMQMLQQSAPVQARPLGKGPASRPGDDREVRLGVSSLPNDEGG